MAKNSGSIKSIMLALIANGAIAIAKLFVAILTGSGSMMAEAIHSFADCTNQGLLLLGLKKAKRPPSPEFPLGHGKEIYFWSFIVALLLFSVGGLFSIYEGVHKLSSTDPISNVWAAIGVLLFAILAEGGSLFGCINEINKIKGEQTLFKWFKTSKQSELLVVFGEDIAALFGLVFALIAISLTAITKNPIYDAVGSIVIGTLLVIVAIIIGARVKSLLIGQGVEERVKKSYEIFLNNREEVQDIYNLITLQMGSDVMVAVKVKMNDFNTPKELITAINNIESDMQNKFPEIVWSFFEPDIVK